MKNNQKLISQMSHNTLAAEITGSIIPELYDSLSVIKGNVDIVMSVLSSLHIDTAINSSLIKQQKNIIDLLKILQNLENYLKEGDATNQHIDLHQTVSNSIDMIKSFCKTDHIQIDLDYDSFKPFIVADPVKLKRLLVNILYLSVKSMQSTGGGRILVTSMNNNENVVLKISDTGIGNNKTDLEIQNNKWLGFAEDFLKDIKATLETKSEIGLGTLYTFTVPLSQQTIKRELNGKALVVDDDADICEILKLYLSNLGLNVDKASNGAVALQKMHDNKYDFVITDLKMPVMRGEEFLEQLIKKDLIGKTKIIMITGCILLDDSDSCYWSVLRRKANGFIQKPFSQDIISKTIKELHEQAELAN